MCSNAVRAAVEGSGVVICERDVSMDRGFREELATLMAKRISNSNDKPSSSLPPRLFVKGMYIGGAEEVLRSVEEGVFAEMIRGMLSKKGGGCGGDGDGACDGCGGLFFLPCFWCKGSCKVVKGWGSSAVVVLEISASMELKEKSSTELDSQDDEVSDISFEVRLE
ncbi:unnamed protein product [Eruca vesicaria subsp. sativa]|uniref:Glutaredoxin domain-containing protein n=1 Tax=Eruca vesicaria subsp. sativa TaxID=29727 RepID=A0ABC8LRY6_ERUVS|nr:unnamed protein product [Eruca vesicaria subsp. sativa]